MHTSLPAPSHKQLRHHVTEQLRAAIMNGEFKPGEFLRQERLAQELGVSQMPVREALKELAAEGLVEHLPYRGVRVVEFSPEDIGDLYAHRSFLEGRAAAVAARHINAEELALLRQLNEEMQANLAPEQIGVYRELNRQFHQVIYTASRREYLVRSLNQMWASFPTMLLGNFASTAGQPLPERDHNDIAEHQAVIDALQSGDSVAAERLLKQHIELSGRSLLGSLRESGA